MRADCRVVSLNRACCYDSRVSVICDLSIAECMGERVREAKFDLLSRLCFPLSSSLPLSRLLLTRS